VRITFGPLGLVPDDRLRANEQETERRCYPRLRERAVPPRLAVVGGGPSVAQHVDALRAWDGEIWAINGAWRWCRERDIEAVFYTVDPLPETAAHARGARRALLADCCDPAVFDGLDREAAVEVFHPRTYGPTSACAAAVPAIDRGHRHVTYFGCEGSFERLATHAYSEGAAPKRTVLAVRCNGRNFLTSPDMVMQTESLAEVLRTAPDVFSERSGGLLRAAVASPDIDVLVGPAAWLTEPQPTPA
jgi:hypothetical protein